MCIWTKDELDEQIALYKKALKSVSVGQSYTIKGRSLTRQDISEIRETLSYFERELKKLAGQSGPVCVVGRVLR